MTTHELGTILAIWAHPDDESWLAAGVMAAARDNGQRVVCVSATAGERGTSDPVLGVEEQAVHDLPDGGLVARQAAGLAWAAGLVGAVRADTILTFGPDGMTYHPDHIAVNRWVTSAWHQGGCHGRLLYATPTAEGVARFGGLYEEWDMYMTDERPTGAPRDRLTFQLRLDDVLVDRKVAALSAMTTQTRDLIAATDDDLFRAMVEEESFVAAVPSRARIVSDLNAMANRDPELASMRREKMS